MVVENVQEKLTTDLEQQLVACTVQLNRSQDYLALVLQAAGAAVWEMNADKKRTLIDVDSHKTLFGEPPTSTADSWSWWSQRIHPDERRCVEDSLLQAIDGDDLCWQRQYCFRMADGEDRWISDTAHIYRDTAGNVQRVIGTMIDIDQRRQTELELADREQRLAAIMKYAAEALIVIDKQGLITDYNTAAGQIFGYSSDELTGQSLSLLIPGDIWDRYEKHIATYALTNDSRIMNQRQEFFGLRKDGSRFPLEITVTAVKQFDLFVGIIRDLSEQRQLEREISNISTWEQEKTGRELHDGLGQRLTALNMLATHVKNRLDQRELAEAELLKDIIVQLKEAAQEVSRISHGLAPISITPDGLADALARLVEQVGGDVDCRFYSRSNIVISNQAAANQIYRIAQEAFNNALKYAQADNIIVTLADIDGAIELSITDDGTGFDMAGLMQRDGFGIRIMRYRASSVGATLLIDTAPGKGTNVCCTYRYQGFPDSDQPLNTF